MKTPLFAALLCLAALRAAAAPGDLHVAKVRAIAAAQAVNGEQAFALTYELPCMADFVAALQTQIGPISLSNPHVAIAVLVRESGPRQCKVGFSVETASFSLPAIAGGYTIE